jgi:hypothetical protein
VVPWRNTGWLAAPRGRRWREPTTHTIDLETFMVFDMLVTNETIYAFYERLPFGRSALGNYRRVLLCRARCLERSGSAAPFEGRLRQGQRNRAMVVDGTERMSVSNIGFRLPRTFMTLDHGGVEEHVSPNQLDCGTGMFTLLDAHLPSRIGLAELSDAPNFYFNEKDRDGEKTAPAAMRFADVFRKVVPFLP